VYPPAPENPVNVTIPLDIEIMLLPGGAPISIPL